MSRWLSSSVAVAAFMVGCRFPELPVIGEDASDGPGADTDATSVDARMCAPSTTTCDDATGVYVECSAQGTPTIERRCPLGCAPSVEKCLDVDPSNGLAPALDVSATGPVVTFTGASTLDSTNGTASNAGSAIAVPTMTIGGIRAFIFNRVRVEGTLKVVGATPVALVANGDVEIVGTIDVSADGAQAGAGATTSGTCIGAFYPGIEVATQGVGGGGGGRATRGANGGANGAGHVGAAGGVPLIDDDLVPLVGGCAGGEGQERSGAYAHALGGGGGGAIQIVSRTSIVMTGAGVIDASGGGGQSASPVGTDTSVCGGGGGSGGAILLEAPVVSMTGVTVTLSCKGGGGAAAGNGSAAFAGEDGGAGVSPASGGANGTLAAGGAGGTESVSPVVGGNGVGSNGDGAGGGGAVGQARVNSVPGMFQRLDGATVRADLTTGTVASRIEP